ncbi:response regulator [bacterium]|nr:MAG: response regulator [bacterium]
MTRRLIVADESIIIQKTIEHILADGDCTIDIYHEGEGALEAVKKSLPDCVLADTGLQGIDGYSLSNSIKREPDLGNIRVILMSSKDDGVDEDKIKESGADDYIVKPFEPDEFLIKISPAVTPEITVEGLRKRVQETEERLASSKKELMRKILYEAIPEIESAVIDEIKKAIEEKIPYTIEKIITEKMDREKGEL